MREIKVNKDNSTINTKNDIVKTELHAITVRLSVALLEKIKALVQSSRCGGNYQFLNASTIIRNALQAYKDGMIINAQVLSNKKKETSFKLSNELKSLYDSLPAKSEILERVINTYLKHNM